MTEIPLHRNSLPGRTVGSVVWILLALFVCSLVVRAAQPAATDTITVEQARSQLLQDALPVPIGVVLVAVGVGFLGLASLRWKSGGWTLVSFGLFSLLYGGRLVVEGGSVQLLLGLEDSTRGHLFAVLSYLIPIPAIVSAMEILGPGWRSSLRWLLRAQILASAVLTIALFLVGVSAGSGYLVRIMAVLAVAGIVGNAVWRSDPSTGRGLLLLGILVLALSVVARNVEGGYSGRAVEAVGVLVFVCCLGVVAARRMIADEKRLLMIDAELESARTIQSSILPQATPGISGLEIVARYRPMTAVAGDFYDFVVVDDRRIGILVADVSGHGVPAALVASMVKVGFQAQASHASNPARVLSGLNGVLHGQLGSQFVTADPCRVAR